MDEVAPVAPRCRKVRCPTCRGILAEPGTPVYQCPLCSTFLEAKGTRRDNLVEPLRKPTTDDDQDSQSSQQLEAVSTGGNVSTMQKSQEQATDPCETDEPGSGNMKLPEQSLVRIEKGSVTNAPKSELQHDIDAGGDGSASTGDTDILKDNASSSSIATAGECIAAGVRSLSNGGGKKDDPASSGGEDSQEEHLLSERMSEQCALSSGDDKPVSQLSSDDAEDKCKPDDIEAVGDCESMEGKDHKDCHIPEEGEGADRISESEIIRDSYDDLSFKYISSALESTNRLHSRKRSSRSSKLSIETSGSKMSNHPTDELPSLSNENSEDNESYSSTSESFDSHDSMDGEFDFPSPAADSMKPTNISGLLFQQQISSPNVLSDIPAAPHQLEWEDAVLENEEIPLQKSINATVASLGAVTGNISGVLVEIEQGDQVESGDGDLYHQRASSSGQTLPVGLQDTATVPIKFLQAQREDGVPGIGCLRSPVGSADLKGERVEETKGDSDGCLGSLSYKVNGHESVGYTDLGEKVPCSPLAVDELLSKLKAGSSLKGANTLGALVLGGIEAACVGSVSDGCDVESCRGSPKTIKSTNTVANIQQDGDSNTSTIDRKNSIIIGGSIHSKNASRMILTGTTFERVSDSLHHQKSGVLQDADDHWRAASTWSVSDGCNIKTYGASPDSWDHQQGGFLKDADNHRRAVSIGDFATERNDEKSYWAQHKEAEYVGMPYISELGNSSDYSVIDNFDARLQLKRNYSSERMRGRDREGTAANMLDSSLHHKRNYSSEETQVQSEGFTRYASQVPRKNLHYEGPRVSRSRRDSDGSSNTHYTHGQAALMHTHGQAALMLGDGQGPRPQQPFGYSCYSDGSDSFARGVPFQYQQVPSHPCLHPVAMPGQAFIHCGCHSVTPVCMTCSVNGHHHSDSPQLSMPPHGFCCNQALPTAHQHGPWNSHQAYQIQPSDQGASVAHYASPWLPSQTVHMHDTVMAMKKQWVPSARKSRLYPPIPRGNAAPYVICKGCEEILKVPTDMPLSDSTIQKLRCGSCYKIAKFSTSKGNHSDGNNLTVQSRTTVASVRALHAVEYPEHNRSLPASSVAQTMESPYDQDLYAGVAPQYKQGSMVSQQQISAAIKRKSQPSSLDEIVPATECEGATSFDRDSRDEFNFKSSSRQHCEFGSSQMFFNGFKAAPSTLRARNYHGEVSAVGNGISLQAPVDEKDEGLDFGAPRTSDGESLDQRSPDSRMRSPEDMRHFQPRNQNGRTQNYGAEDRAKAENLMLELKKRSIAQGKRPTQTLLSLINQESSKFEINMEGMNFFDDSRSTASNSPVHAHLTNENPGAGLQTGDESRPQPSKLTPTGFVRKGQKYAAGMLRRSVKHFQREGH